MSGKDKERRKVSTAEEVQILEEATSAEDDGRYCAATNWMRQPSTAGSARRGPRCSPRLVSVIALARPARIETSSVSNATLIRRDRGTANRYPR